MTTVQLIDIRSWVNKIREAKEKGVEKEVALKTFQEFYDTYPSFFEMLYSENCNLDHLQYILSKYEEVRVGSQTFEEASVEVGQSFFDTYATPEMKKRSEEVKEKSENAEK